MKSTHKSLMNLAVLASVLFVLPVVGVAGPINVLNPGFEDRVTFPQNDSGASGEWNPTTVPQWTLTDGTTLPAPDPIYGWGGVFDPVAGFTIQPYEGNQYAYLNGGTLTQVLSTNVTPGELYSLVVAVGRRSAPAFMDLASFGIELLAGGTSLGSINSPVASVANPNSWGLVMVLAQAPGNASGPLEIRLSSDGAQVLFDAVSLNDSTIPEPGAFFLFGGGLLGVFLYRRARRA